VLGLSAKSYPRILALAITLDPRVIFIISIIILNLKHQRAWHKAWRMNANNHWNGFETEKRNKSSTQKDYKERNRVRWLVE
jgi:hypothetical protein